MVINRQKKPTPDSLTNFKLPEILTFRLTNGLPVYFIVKNNLPMLRLNLVISAGSKCDIKDKYGMSSLTSMLIDEAAEGLSSLEISDEFDRMGSQWNIFSDNDSTTISLQSLTENADRSIELASKILLKPDFKADDFKREKLKLVTRLIQTLDDPEYLADQISEKIILKGSGYSHPVLGYSDSVENILHGDISLFYQSNYSPQSSYLVATGNIEILTLQKILNSYFGNWKSTDKSDSSFNLSYPGNKKIFFYNKPGSVQTEIRVGHLSEKRSDENYFQRLLLNTILGGQFSSRININLREKNGYTYGANSRFNYLKDAAFFRVDTSVGSEFTSKAINEILKELAGIRDGVTDAELEFAKSSIINKFPLNFETHRQIVSNLSSMVFYDLPLNYFNNYINSVKNITKDDVKEAAQQFIQPDYSAIYLVADKNLVLKDIEKLNLEIVEVNEKGEVLS